MKGHVTLEQVGRIGLSGSRGIKHNTGSQELGVTLTTVAAFLMIFGRATQAPTELYGATALPYVKLSLTRCENHQQQERAGRTNLLPERFLAEKRTSCCV